MANSHIRIVVLLLVSSWLLPLLHAQQPYDDYHVADCQSQSPTSLGYSCNGRSKSCQTFLTFRTRAPSYLSVAAIASLFGSNRSQLARANLVADNAAFPNNTKVLVPVECSCSSLFYQYNVSYSVQDGGTAYIIATDVYQGLTTCRAIETQDKVNDTNLKPGMVINIPLRCACPTSKQTNNGVKFLLTYLVDQGDTLGIISSNFQMEQEPIRYANQISLTVENPSIDFSTTLLIPLEKQPDPSQLVSPPQPPPPPPPPPPPRRSSPIGLYVGIGVGAAALVLVLSIMAACLATAKRKKKTELYRSDDEEISMKQYEISSGMSRSFEDVLLAIAEIGQALKVYKYEELQEATKNFIQESHIQGSVYRGVFKGSYAAVKIMSRDVSKEIGIMKKINHINLVKLLGVCFHGGRWYLVYEYVQNGSLNNWIFDRSGSKALSWIQRVLIALDVATGLNYLHSFTSPAHVHRDINCYNILLDGNFRAKIANFWQARAAESEDGNFLDTRRIVGTQGYIAPEYLEHGLVSPKLDVYAFGIMLLEMITGRSVTEARQENAICLIDLLAAIDQEDAGEKLKEFIDPLLGGDYPQEKALVLSAKLVQQCLLRDSSSRPTMEELTKSLSKLLALSHTTG